MKPQPHRLSKALAVALMCSSAAVAAQPAADNATANLIRLLVEQGVLQPEQAAALLKQAQSEAAAAAVRTGGTQPGDVRVPYIPQTVRDQIRDEVKQEVMATAKSENWAAPNTFPDWVSRITVDGDVRVRFENRGFSSGNSPEINDFARFNERGPFEVMRIDNVGVPEYTYPPLLNTRKSRNNQLRFRARLGVKAQLSDQWSAGVRLASGSSKSPVSTTDNFGGGFSKKDFWLDQAWLNYKPASWASLTAGRASNPFVSTDILYSSDLNFDGVSAVFSKPLPDSPFTLRGALGAFLIENTHNPSQLGVADGEGETKNKWLLGAQIGGDWKINAEQQLGAHVAYYTFQNIQGRLSEPCQWYQTVCSTDWSRPAFMQKGNTLFYLRDLIPPPPGEAGSLYQYVGLASKFNLLDLNVNWKGRVGNGLGLMVSGNYIRNLAYSSSRMADHVGEGFFVNNVDGDSNIRSGGNAWTIHAALGKGYSVVDRGDWQVFAGYKYIQPDAVPDAYNDSTFHLGGTNAKGYYLGAAYAVEKNVVGQLRWTSSREIYGSPLSINVMQLELNARF